MCQKRENWNLPVGRNRRVGACPNRAVAGIGRVDDSKKQLGGNIPSQLQRLGYYIVIMRDLSILSGNGQIGHFPFGNDMCFRSNSRN